MSAILSTMPRAGSRSSGLRKPDRYRLERAGVLNVWQYDDQVFDFADGRLLLRGANGAGKSKTLEMLLPFVLDGDKLRMTASGRHHTSLLWLMSDGYEGQSRIGYLWVELARPDETGAPHVLTCGIGIRWSSSAKQATTWHFTCPRRVGVDLILDDGSGPLNKERCRAEVERDGHFFEQPRAYKEHVGQLLFGLEPGRYDELLRLLYWLRQPQVGEDIEPSKLASQLAQALPELDQAALRAAGDTFDELAHFGTQIERRERAAAAIRTLADVHAGYATAAVRLRGAGLVIALNDLRRRDADIARARAVLDEIERAMVDAEGELAAADADVAQAASQRRALEASPEFRSRARLLELGNLAHAAQQRAEQATADHDGMSRRIDRAETDVAGETRELVADVVRLGERGHGDAARLGELGVSGYLAVPAALHEPTLEERPDADRLTAAVVEMADAAAAMSPAIGEALAAVSVVEEARGAVVRADRLRADEERRAAEAEARAEDERARLSEARAAATTAEDRFRSSLAAWRGDARAVPVDLPDDLTGEAVRTIQPRARTAAQPRLDELTFALTEAAARRKTAETLLHDLRGRREQILTERDPAPPPPPLGRSPRSDTDGAPLWRLVDPLADLPPEQRAGLEAGLESAGLLDAWVRRDGAVLDAEHRDVVIAVGPPVAGRSLADVLRPSTPAGCVVAVEVVEQVLARVGLVEVISAADGAQVSLRGEWRLGPVRGRASKPVAQFLGATARAAERLRRLSAVDAELTETTVLAADAAAAEAAARVAIRDLEEWLAASPPPHEVERAWASLEVRGGNADRAEESARRSRESAVLARATAATRHRELDELATRYALPVDEHLLAARRFELQELRTVLASYSTHRLRCCAKDSAGGSATLIVWRSCAAMAKPGPRGRPSSAVTPRTFARSTPSC